jgi:hypothetical protein
MENIYLSGFSKTATVLRVAIKGTLYNQSEMMDTAICLCDLGAQLLHKESHSVVINIQVPKQMVNFFIFKVTPNSSMKI